MATYNGSKYIEEQLNSLFNQERLPDELVVCDDASLDSTHRILQEYAKVAPFRIIVVRNEKNIGFAKNFEKALSICTGDLIFLSDQDDVWDKRKISKILAIKIEHPEIDLIINDAEYVDENLNPLGMTVLAKVLKFSGKKDDHIAGASTVITKEFKKFLLPFPECNCPAHDIYIHRWANLLKNKLVIPEVLQCWRIHQKNNSISEMNHAAKVSLLGLFNKYKAIDSSASYILKAKQLNEMMALVNLRKKLLLNLASSVDVNELKNNINNMINANIARSLISEASLFKRVKLILFMMLKGQYKYFHGYKSIAKDLLKVF